MTKHNQAVGMHVLSGLALLSFSFLALASIDLFGKADYLEQPCSEITPVTTTYSIVIQVKDKVTGEPIPNANIETVFSHRQCKFLENGKCQVSPGAIRYSEVSGNAGQDGKLTLITNPLTIGTSLDYTSIMLDVSANHYSSQAITRELNPNNPNVTIDVRLINLNTQP